MEVRPLDRDSAAELIRVRGGLAPEEARRRAELSNGVPLACEWLAGLDSVAAAIELEQVLERRLSHAGAGETHALNVLVELPAPLQVQDLAAAMGVNSGEAQNRVDELQRLGLARPSQGHGEVRVGHALIRQFLTQRSNADLAVWHGVLVWARNLARESGGDRNWRGYAAIRRNWDNLVHVLTCLHAQGPRRDLGTFLDLWRRLDYFMWAQGRWRDRVRWGRLAADATRGRGERSALRAHALYDSIAETRWHQGDRSPEIAALLDEAERMYEELGEGDGVARVRYYRSRYRRACGDATEGLREAERGLGTQGLAPHTRGLLLNSKGNAAGVLQNYDLATSAYQQAQALFEGHEAQDEEMAAIVRRNLGRMLNTRGEADGALENLENALRTFSELGLVAEESETAGYHAETLRALGEPEEAREELSWALERLEVCGLGSIDQATRLRRLLTQG